MEKAAIFDLVNDYVISQGELMEGVCERGWGDGWVGCRLSK